MTTIRQINKFLKEKKIENKEVTRHQGKYLVLHICKNNVSVSLWSGINIDEAFEYLKGVIERSD